MSSDESLRTRFRGALLGVAVGDGLGAPFEGTPSVPADELARLELEEEAGPLRYTDDTHMTIGLARSLLECGGFDGAHMATRFAADFSAEPWRGYGPGPPRVFALLAQGEPWDQAAVSLFGGSGSFGNGAAMRVAPVALFTFPDVSRAARLARQTARITHSHELGMEGAALQAAAVAQLLGYAPGDRFDRRFFLAALRTHVASDVYLHKLGLMEELLRGARPEEVVAGLGNGIAASESVPTALFAFLRHPGSFVDAVRYAISLGGDTDTIASMTGALSGAYLGEGAIPAWWRENVEGASVLRSLADELLG